MKITDQSSLVEAGEILLEKSGASHIVITLGKDGIAAFSLDDPEVKLFPTCSQEVYDVSGAGDTVIAMLSLVLAAGGTLSEAAILANLAAGIEVGKRGTATVTAEEVQRAMRLWAEEAL